MVHGMPNLSDLEAVTDCGGAARAPHENRGRSIGANAMRSVLALRPFDRPLCFCQRRKGASLQTATCHRSSQPRCGPTLCDLHIGPESCAVAREGFGEALTGGRIGQPLSRERFLFWVPKPCI